MTPCADASARVPTAELLARAVSHVGSIEVVAKLARRARRAFDNPRKHAMLCVELETELRAILASPSAQVGPGPDLGSGPGPVIAGGALLLAIILAGSAFYLYRRR